MSLEPKPRAKMAPDKPSPWTQRTKRRQEVAPQVKVVISRQAKVYLERVSERTGLPQNLVMDQVLREAQKLEREVNKLVSIPQYRSGQFRL